MIVIKAQSQVPSAGMILTTKTTWKVFADEEIPQMQEFLDNHSEAEITIQKF